MAKPVFGVSDSNQSPQLQKLARNFTCSKFRYDTFQKANNKGADQTAQAGLRLCLSQDRFSQIEAHMITLISGQK